MHFMILILTKTLIGGIICMLKKEKQEFNSQGNCSSNWQNDHVNPGGGQLDSGADFKIP